MCWQFITSTFPEKAIHAHEITTHALAHTWLSFTLRVALPNTSASHDKAIISVFLLQEMHCVIRRSCSDSAHNILAGLSDNPYSRLLVKDYRKLSFSLFCQKSCRQSQAFVVLQRKGEVHSGWVFIIVASVNSSFICWKTS